MNFKTTLTTKNTSETWMTIEDIREDSTFWGFLPNINPLIPGTGALFLLTLALTRSPRSAFDSSMAFALMFLGAQKARPPKKSTFLEDLITELKNAEDFQITHLELRLAGLDTLSLSEMQQVIDALPQSITHLHLMGEPFPLKSNEERKILADIFLKTERYIEFDGPLKKELQEATRMAFLSGLHRSKKSFTACRFFQGTHPLSENQVVHNIFRYLP